MELGQEGWLKQLVAKVREPIVADDQGSRQGYQCSETSLTGEPSSSVPLQEWVHPRDMNRCPLGGKQVVDPPDQRDCVVE
jgi:hypothetical protein